MSASSSTEALLSQSTAELFSSSSSLTGISFSSSNDAFDICDQLKHESHASTAMKDKAADMPTYSSNLEEDALECVASNVSPRLTGCDSVPSSHILALVAKGEALDNNPLDRIENIELRLEDKQGNLIKEKLVTDVEAPSKQFPKSFEASEDTSFCFKQNGDSGNVGNNNENQIRKVQAALPEKTESEDPLKQRLVYLKNELNSAVNNSDYWFNQCVKKREKIEELLSCVRDVNTSNFELRQEINNKSRTINEKDQEIQRLTESNTENEMLLQEVRENLFKANEETERLKMLIKKFNEEKLRTVQTDKILQALFEKALEIHKSKNNEKETFYTTHKETESDMISSRNKKVLKSGVKKSEVKNSENTRPPSTSNASFCGSNVINKSRARNENEGKVLFGEPFSNEPCSLRNSLMLKDPAKTKKAIRECLGEVITQAKTKFSTERKVVSFNEGTSTDGSLKRVANETEDARSSLRQVVTSFKEKISKKKNLSAHSRVPITNEYDRQETQRSKKSSRKRCYDWNPNDTKVDNRPFALTTTDTKDGSLVKLAADVSTDTFDSMEPFADVFLTKFESTDVLSPDSIHSVEPFCEVLIPWQNSEDAGIKQTIEAFKRSITVPKQHPDKTAHLGDFFLANGAESITLEEKKAAESAGTIQKSYVNMFLFI